MLRVLVDCRDNVFAVSMVLKIAQVLTSSTIYFIVSRLLSRKSSRRAVNRTHYIAFL